MAPPAYKRDLPCNPQDAGNRVLKTKASSSKSNTDGKSIRLAAYSAEILRKAEAIERALCVSLCSADETIETEEEIMDETLNDTSSSVFGPKAPRVTIAQCQTQNDISTEIHLILFQLL